MRPSMLLAAFAAPALAFTSLNHVFGLRGESSPAVDKHGVFLGARTSVVRPRTVAIPAKLGNVTASQFVTASTLVESALDKIEELNRERLASPERNLYSPRTGGPSLSSRPRFHMTDKLKAAASLVSKIDSLNSGIPQVLGPRANQTFTAEAATGTYWMQNIARKGTWPWGNNPKHVVGIA
jgi:hypothetical protein